LAYLGTFDVAALAFGVDEVPTTKHAQQANREKTNIPLGHAGFGGHVGFGDHPVTTQGTLSNHPVTTQ